MTTDQLRLPQLGLQRPVWLPAGTGPLLLVLPVAVALGAIAALQPEWWRGVLAAVLTVNLIVLGMKWPRAAAVATLLWLPFLGFVRRVLIGEVAWAQNDPLILVGPLAALFLCYRLFMVEKRQLAPDRLSKLALALVLLAAVSVFNPLGTAGFLGNLAGMIYLAVPLLWFFIGRELGTARIITLLMYAVAGVSILVAGYGMYQTEFGSLPQWDLDWYYTTGYGGVVASRSEGGSLLFRPFATFASASEYSGYLAIALVFAIAMLMHRRPVLAISIPVLFAGVLLSGGRSVMALTLLTVVVMAALRTRNTLIALVILVAGIGATYGAALAFGDRIDRAAGLSGSANTERQASGLLNPLDPQKSTFLNHWDNLWNGVKDGFTNPVGLGAGASNIGARVAGGENRETDIDIADAFVSLGFVGGLIFLAIIVLSFRTVFSRYIRAPAPDPLLLGIAGIMVVNFGQWLQGGHYAASALMWFLLGWAVRPTPESIAQERPVVEGLARWREWAPWRRRAVGPSAENA